MVTNNKRLWNLMGIIVSVYQVKRLFRSKKRGPDWSKYFIRATNIKSWHEDVINTSICPRTLSRNLLTLSSVLTRRVSPYSCFRVNDSGWKTKEKLLIKYSPISIPYAQTNLSFLRYSHLRGQGNVGKGKWLNNVIN